MKGKVGLVVGLGAGYILGARAGRKRYEQIKKQWLKVWHLDPVQEQVDRVSEFARSQAAAVPMAVWHGAVKVVKAVGSDATAGQKLDAVIATGKEAAEEIADAAEETAEAAKATADDVKDTATDAARDAAKSVKGAAENVKDETAAPDAGEK